MLSRKCSASTLMAILGGAVYMLAVWQLGHYSRNVVHEEMRVVLPRFLQVGMSGGDRYLAANVGMFRAMVAATDKMSAQHFAVQARVQEDVSWFNPAHEDNYYVAAAILPWFGELSAGQRVLARAHDARPYDWQPAFYYAFNIYHFDRDPASAAGWLLKAAPRAALEEDRYMLENIAAFWFEKGHDTATALGVINRMAEQARSGGFRRYLLSRAERLRSLLKVEEIAEEFKLKNHRAPASIAELETYMAGRDFPKDPVGFGFELDRTGVPRLRNAPKEGN